MPLQINELHVRISVEDDSGADSSSTGGANGPNEINESLIRACVERVLEILKTKSEP